MMFHKGLAERQRRHCEGVWLNDKLAVPGMSNVNPLMQKKAKGRKQQPAVKTLKAKPMDKALKQMPGIARTMQGKLQPYEGRAIYSTRNFLRKSAKLLPFGFASSSDIPINGTSTSGKPSIRVSKAYPVSPPSDPMRRRPGANSDTL